MGKGSSRRPTDQEAFDSNYDAIFGKKDTNKYGLELDEYLTELEQMEQDEQNE